MVFQEQTVLKQNGIWPFKENREMIFLCVFCGSKEDYTWQNRTCGKGWACWSNRALASLLSPWTIKTGRSLITQPQKYRHTKISQYLMMWYCIDVLKHCIDILSIADLMTLFCAVFGPPTKKYKKHYNDEDCLHKIVCVFLIQWE